MAFAIEMKKISDARERISRYVRQTPLIRCEKLDSVLDCEAYFKLECLQITGSFKARGAVNKLLSLTEQERARGVVTASSGNHAQGVAYAGNILGVKTIVVLPEDVAEAKLDGCVAYGATIVKHGHTSAERRAKAEEIKNDLGLVSIHSYDDPDIIAGQGTAGLEILDSLSDADYVVVPVGGGGLISGVATAIKEKRGQTKIIGVEPAVVPRYTKSLEEGHPAVLPTRDTCADALKAAKAGVNNYEIIKKYVDKIVTVEDEHIVKAFELVLLNTKVLAEPSSCVGVAAVLSGKIKLRNNDKVVFLLSGGNIDKSKIVKLLTDMR